MKEEPTSSSSSGHIEKSQNEPAEHMERKVSRFDKVFSPIFGPLKNVYLKQQLNIFIAIDKRKRNYYLDATKLCDENLGNCVRLQTEDVKKFIYWNCTSKLETPYDYNRRMHARLDELRQ
ncbi:hypothetical protein B9Z55_020610 [Caenorhabditis nigoni]|uniref:Uncharacterized protein n=1 Tax=Caenorhabditis nigoni TaxID=1611254 RepID=A0A2G5TND4_9PELO|nr:hypothetical protein B9Z55_020610 [Caenorhabditis nigoni]